MRVKPPVPHASRGTGLAFVAGLLTLLVGVPLHAISTGIVPMTTSDLKLTFWQGSLLPDTLAPGADPILDVGLVLRGVPLVTQAGTPSLGSADTVIEIREGTNFPPPFAPVTRMIRTRVVAMHLVNAKPLTVTYNGGNPELWDYEACISRVTPEANEPLDGFMTLVNDCRSAGSFVSTLVIRPKVIFTRRRDGRRVVFDQDSGMNPVIVISHGTWTLRSWTAGEFLQVSSGAMVDQDCDGTFDTTLPATADVVFGVERVGCNWQSPNQGYAAIRPITQSFYQFQVMTPTPQIGGPPYPLPVDNRSITPVCEPVGGQP